MSLVALVEDQVLSSTSGLGGEVGLGWKDAAVSGLLAAAGVCLVLERVVCGDRGEGRMKSERAFRVDSLAGRAPQAQVDPVSLAFSSLARSQVHWPAGRAPIESLMSES